jgi:D-alanyl-D-alanine carboxypeptidase
MASAVQAEMQQAGYPGMLVGVWTQGQGRFVATPGVADTATGRPLEPRDAARVGSVTKTFTATVVLQLVEEGKIGLNDPVKRYLDRVPRGSKVTIRMLLNHTSGIPSFPPGVVNASIEQPHRHWRPNQLIFRGLRQKRLAPPGRQWHYSNVNYVILGTIAEQVTGEPMHRLYRERIFEPLGLEHTRFVPNASMPAGAAHGYFLKKPTGSFIDTFGWDASWAFTAGAMVSTLGDLHRYAPALATGTGLLNARTQRKRLTFVDVPSEGIGYGLGIFTISLGTTTLQNYLGHNGIVPGYDSIVLHSPAARTTIAIVGTTAVEEDAFPGDQIHPGLIDLTNSLAAIAQGEPVQQ